MVCRDRSLIGPPLLDDDASSTIEHDIMRLVREWMHGEASEEDVMISAAEEYSEGA